MAACNNNNICWEVCVQKNTIKIIISESLIANRITFSTAALSWINKTPWFLLIHLSRSVPRARLFFFLNATALFASVIFLPVAFSGGLTRSIVARDLWNAGSFICRHKPAITASRFLVDAARFASRNGKTNILNNLKTHSAVDLFSLVDMF